MAYAAKLNIAISRWLFAIKSTVSLGREPRLHSVHLIRSTVSRVGHVLLSQFAYPETVGLKPVDS